LVVDSGVEAFNLRVPGIGKRKAVMVVSVVVETGGKLTTPAATPGG